MRVKEVITESVNDAGRLTALAQFLISRAEDTAAKKKISTQSFVKLAQNMGVSLTAGQLKDMSQRPPLSNLIQNIEGDDETGEITFSGGEIAAPNMSPGQAEKKVDQMAKRATDI